MYLQDKQTSESLLMAAALTISANPERNSCHRVFAAWQYPNHKFRLVEHTEHVFISPEIHTVFAADTGIHLRKQGGGNKSEPQSAHIYRSSKTATSHTIPPPMATIKVDRSASNSTSLSKITGKGFQGFVFFSQTD